MSVVQFQPRKCSACRDRRHLRCREWFSWLDDEDCPCPCGCWDSDCRETAGWAQAQHAAADPAHYARVMRARLTLERSLHLCASRDRWQ